MKHTCSALALAAIMIVGCEQKAAKPAAAAAPVAADGKRKHINTDREGFQAAGRAAKAIEGKGEDRNAAADEAMKAGE